MRPVKSRNRNPRWARLYAVIMVLVALLGLVEVGVPEGPARRVLEVFVTLVMFGVMAIWVRGNRVELMLENEPDRPGDWSQPVSDREDQLGARSGAHRYTSGAVEEYLTAVGNGRRAVGARR